MTTRVINPTRKKVTRSISLDLAEALDAYETALRAKRKAEADFGACDVTEPTRQKMKVLDQVTRTEKKWIAVLNDLNEVILGDEV